MVSFGQSTENEPLEPIEDVRSKTYGIRTQHEITKTYKEDKPSCLRRVFPDWYREELRETFRLAWPMILISVFQYLLIPITLLFCGHLNTVDLGAVALACTVINVMGIAIGNGLTTACDTLFSQTYGGANLKLYGEWLQRSLIIMSLACIPCWAIHLNTETLLVLLGQDRLQASIAGRYMLLFLPGVLANFIYQTLAKYLQNQNVVLPLILVGVFGNLVNALMHYILLFVFDFGTDGSAIAQVIGHLSFMLATIFYILISGIYKETWGGWSSEAFTKWGQFISYALPGMCMLFLDFMCFEIGTFTAGVLGEADLAAMAVILQLGTMAYQVPCGCAYTCSIRVGQHLGANNPKAARRAALVAWSVALMAALIIVIFFISASTVIPRAFTVDPAVIEIAVQLMPLLAIYEFCDATAAVSGGALRGCGKQIIGAVGVFLGFYGVGIPIAMSLMFLTDLRTAGFWWGMSCGVTTAAVILFVIAIFITNWKREARLAMRRAGIEKKRRESEKHGIDVDMVVDETTGLMSTRPRSQSAVSNASSTFSVASSTGDPDVRSKQALYTKFVALVILFALLAVAVYLHLTIIMPWVPSEICVPRNETNSSAFFSNASTIVIGNITYHFC